VLDHPEIGALYLGGAVAPAGGDGADGDPADGDPAGGDPAGGAGASAANGPAPGAAR
jgi:hypothetical protein